MNAESAGPGAGKGRILVVEDDRSLREGLAMTLRLQGYEVLTAADGEEGMRQAFDARPDLIVLDIMLPHWTGLDILDELRTRGEAASVLILSARGATSDKVKGLHLGADDYLAKPFDLPELLARVDVIFRRRRAMDRGAATLECGDLTIDRAARAVRRRGRAIALSAREFDLLCLLAASPGQVFTRDIILEKIWGWDYDGTARTVDNFVASLRKKLRVERRAPELIDTVPRVGYKFSIPARR